MQFTIILASAFAALNMAAPTGTTYEPQPYAQPYPSGIAAPIYKRALEEAPVPYGAPAYEAPAYVPSPSGVPYVHKRHESNAPKPEVLSA